VEAAIDKRSSMSAIGNLNDYVKFQMAQGMEKGGGAGGAATELAVGLAMAQQIVQQQGGALGTGAGAGAAAAAAPAAAPAPDLLTPADAAKALGVTEADVMASIEAGDLKAKKIGTAYRITRAAFNEFLQH
jgi:excisionase family DNA binding protein